LLLLLERGPIYLQSVIIHSANGGKGEGCLVEKYSVELLSVRGSETGGDSGEYTLTNKKYN
jgi:hypothetical protein